MNTAKLTITLFSLVHFYCFGQSNTALTSLENGKTTDLFDTIVRQEIASFTITKTFGQFYRSSCQKKTSEIKMIRCLDTLVIFQDLNIFGNKKLIDLFLTQFDASQHNFTYEGNKIIKIDDKDFYGTNGEMPKRKIKLVGLLYSSHRVIEIPDTAYNDLYEPGICSDVKEQRKEKFANRFQVFQSEDKKRTYIYMLNGIFGNKYEVTWVIIGAKYVGRVVDRLSE